MVYLVLDNISKMDRLCNQENKYKLDCDLQPGKLLLFHKFQDKDPYIFDLSKLDLKDILN